MDFQAAGPSKKRIHALVKGRVQGVGFRYFTQDRARSRGLTGWVRNMEDGSVEFEAEGAAKDVDFFANEIKEGPALSNVSEMTVGVVPVEENEKRFEIIP
jgi:acylphosphatase